jgi:hypothetical protein
MFRKLLSGSVVCLMLMCLGGAAQGPEDPEHGPTTMNWAFCKFYPPGGGRSVDCTSPGLLCVEHEDSCVINNVVVVTDRALFAEMGYDACAVDNTPPMRTCTMPGHLTTCMAVGLFQNNCNGMYICLKSRKILGC